MNPIAICIAFIVSIVSIGTPLVFQVISTFDEKYHSENIIKLFENKSKKRCFQIVLKITSILVAVYIIVSIIAVNTTYQIINIGLEWISYILIFLSAILVGLFIRFTLISIMFSRPTSLLNYLIKSDKAKKYKDTGILKSVIDVAINAIQKKDFPTFHEKIINYFIDVFKNNINMTTELLPEKYYEIGYRITKELASYKSRDFDQFKQLTIDKLWMMNKLDDTAYNRLWKNLRTVIENKEDEMVYYYWKRAFEHIEYNLRIPDSIYSAPLSTEKLNQEEIDKITEERSEFIDFHYYLGGLLLYENRIESIRRIWEYTNSQPPKYPLLPLNLDKIFILYFKYCLVFDQDLWNKAARFNFPRNDGVNFDWIINGWIRKYLILLFLRQYTLHEYYIYQKFLTLPKSPETQDEKKHWIDNIQEFENWLKEILSNTELLKTLQFDYITEEWCNVEKKIYPLELVDNFKRQLEEDFGQANINQRVSPEKERKFWASSKQKIEAAIEEYKGVVTTNVPADDKNWRDPFYIMGSWQKALKSDFAGDQPYDHLNYDSFLAEQVANNLRWAISETFLSVTTQGYLLKEEDLFKAIDKLKITEKPNDFVIISFKNNIAYYISGLKVPGLSDTKYKEVDLIDKWNCSGHIVGNTFFILRKSDLPYLQFEKSVSKWGIEWKKEEMIIPDKHILASIIDLHEHPEVIQKLKEEGDKENLDDKVLVTIEILTHVLWKKDAKVIAIRAASAYEDRGLPNKLEEIKPFDKI